MQLDQEATWNYRGKVYHYSKQRVGDVYGYSDTPNPKAIRWFLFDWERNHIGDFRTLKELQTFVKGGDST